MTEFQFHSGPDLMTATIRHFSNPDENGNSAYLTFEGKGPRGGYASGPMLKHDAMVELAALLDEALGYPHRCRACGREEEVCSDEPCEAVIEDREATD